MGKRRKENKRKRSDKPKDKRSHSANEKDSLATVTAALEADETNKPSRKRCYLSEFEVMGKEMVEKALIEYDEIDEFDNDESNEALGRAETVEDGSHALHNVLPVGDNIEVSNNDLVIEVTANIDDNANKISIETPLDVSSIFKIKKGPPSLKQRVKPNKRQYKEKECEDEDYVPPTKKKKNAKQSSAKTTTHKHDENRKLKEDKQENVGQLKLRDLVVKSKQEIDVLSKKFNDNHSQYPRRRVTNISSLWCPHCSRKIKGNLKAHLQGKHKKFYLDRFKKNVSKKYLDACYDYYKSQFYKNENVINEEVFTKIVGPLESPGNKKVCNLINTLGFVIVDTFGYVVDIQTVPADDSDNEAIFDFESESSKSIQNKDLDVEMEKQKDREKKKKYKDAEDKDVAEEEDTKETEDEDEEEQEDAEEIENEEKEAVEIENEEEEAVEKEEESDEEEAAEGTKDKQEEAVLVKVGKQKLAVETQKVTPTCKKVNTQKVKPNPEENENSQVRLETEKGSTSSQRSIMKDLFPASMHKNHNILVQMSEWYKRYRGTAEHVYKGYIARANKIITYMCHGKVPLNNEKQIIINVSNAVRFEQFTAEMDDVKSGVETTVNYINTYIDLLDFVHRICVLKKCTDLADDIIRAKAMIKDGIRKSYHKKISTLRCITQIKESRTYEDDTLAKAIHDIEIMLSTAESNLESLECLFQNKDPPYFNSSKIRAVWLNVYRQILVIGHKKGYRPGVLQNALIGEFEDGKWSTNDEHYTFHVADHKNASAGPATVALDTREYKIFERYAVVRKKIEEFFEDGKVINLDRQHLLVNSKQKKVEKGSQEIKRCYLTNGLTNCDTNHIRKYLETGASKCGEDTKAKMAKHLSHSQATATKHYTIPTADQASGNFNVTTQVLEVSKLNLWNMEQVLKTLNLDEHQDFPSYDNAKEKCEAITKNNYMVLKKQWKQKQSSYENKVFSTLRGTEDIESLVVVDSLCKDILGLPNNLIDVHPVNKRTRSHVRNCDTFSILSVCKVQQELKDLEAIENELSKIIIELPIQLSSEAAEATVALFSGYACALSCLDIRMNYKENENTCYFEAKRNIAANTMINGITGFLLNLNADESKNGMTIPQCIKRKISVDGTDCLIFGAVALIEFSCCPNLMIVTSKNNKLEVMAATELKKNERLSLPWHMLGDPEEHVSCETCKDKKVIYKYCLKKLENLNLDILDIFPTYKVAKETYEVQALTVYDAMKSLWENTIVFDRTKVLSDIRNIKDAIVLSILDDLATALIVDPAIGSTTHKIGAWPHNLLQKEDLPSFKMLPTNGNKYLKKVKKLVNNDAILQSMSVKGQECLLHMIEDYSHVVHSCGDTKILKAEEYNMSSSYQHCKVVATHKLKPGLVINIKGYTAKLNSEQMSSFEKKGRNFSVMQSQMSKKPKLLLGPIAYVNHSCKPNTEYHTIDKYNITLKVTTKIKEGEEITVSYGTEYFGKSVCKCQFCNE